MPVKSFKAAVVADQPMMDDQFTVVHWAAVESDGTPASIPSGAAAPVTTTAPSTAVTLDASADPTGLNVRVNGVKGKSGTETLTITFTNADGTTAQGTATVDVTIDPTELDVAGFNGTFDPPQKQ